MGLDVSRFESVTPVESLVSLPPRSGGGDFFHCHAFPSIFPKVELRIS